MNKAFTLIELLAVIVILAIIALIAVPIILNIIEDTEKSANKRSKEMYLDAVEQSIARKNLTSSFNPSKCTVIENGNLNCSGEKLIVEYKGEKPNVGGSIILKDGKIISDTITFGGTNETNKQICTLVDGEPQKVGSKYECKLDETRIFYVLENSDSSDTITLLMDRNYTDEEVPIMMSWCLSGTNSGCNHDGLDPYIEKIQIKFGSKVIVGIPSYEQVTAIGCSSSNESCPLWAYDYLDDSSGDYPKPNPVEGVQGYWTSIAYPFETGRAWSVYFWGRVLGTDVDWDSINGIRPMITISKSELS